MRGIDESLIFYEKHGKEMIHCMFPEYEDRISVGLVGHGSQCYGYDDDISRDHDFSEGFCMWLTDEDFNKIGTQLINAYKNILPEDLSKHSLGGESSACVKTIDSFYIKYLGTPTVPVSLFQWLSIPSWALAEAVNGKVFRDDLGQFTKIRNILELGYPEDVRLKKMAARAFTMAQSGQYNYSRCLSHNEPGAAALALNEFVIATCDMVFLLNRKYMPYYKWSLKAMRELTVLGNIEEALTYLLTADNTDSIDIKKAVIEDICINIINEIKEQGLSHGNWDFLEPHAFEIMEHINNKEIKNLNISEG